MAQAISRFRQSLGDTQQQFAARTGLSVTSVARYETNSRPSAKVLSRFAEIATAENFPAFVEIFENRTRPEQEIDLQNFSAVKQLLERLIGRFHPSQTLSGRLALACLLAPPERIGELERLASKFLPAADEALDRAATELVRARDPKVEGKRLRFLKTREIEDWLDFSQAYEDFRATQMAKAQSQEPPRKPMLDLFSVEVKGEGGVPVEITESTVFTEEWDHDAFEADPFPRTDMGAREGTKDVKGENEDATRSNEGNE